MASSIKLPLMIQWLFTKRMVSEAEFLQEAKIMCGEDKNTSVPDLNQISQALRQDLALYHLDLKRVYSFDLEGHFWVLYNTVQDQISQLATSYSAEEIDCFKLLVKFISDSKKFQASTLDAIIHASGKLGKKECEGFIEDLVRSHWFQKNSSGKLCLGLRTIVELGEYLREEDLFHDCIICNSLVTSKALYCGSTINESCSVQIHQTCYQRVGNASEQFQCPSCTNTEFTLDRNQA